jgi:hypothetical protein
MLIRLLPRRRSHRPLHPNESRCYQGVGVAVLKMSARLQRSVHFQRHRETLEQPLWRAVADQPSVSSLDSSQLLH